MAADSRRVAEHWEKIDRFRRLPPLAKVVVLLFVGAFVVYGGGKMTNQVNQTSGTNIVEIVVPTDQPERARCPFHIAGHKGGRVCGTGVSPVRPCLSCRSTADFASPRALTHSAEFANILSN